MREEKFFFLVLMVVSSALSTKPRLNFRADGTFRIVQFTDLHYGEKPFPQRDENTTRVQNTVLDIERPDLVVLTGDSISGYVWPHQNDTIGWARSTWNQMIQPMLSRDIPWAAVLGNHDDQGDASRVQLAELDASYNISLTQMGPSHLLPSVTNYQLHIYGSEGRPSTSLWMFDSFNYSCQGVEGYGCVTPETVQWYRQKSIQTEKKHGRLPGLAFFHIPFPEYISLWNSQTVLGSLEDEGVCCSSVNTGLYSAFKERGDVVAAFCGHDHSNDFSGDWYGVQLAYGRKTGYGAYGPPPGWSRGARVIEITEKPFRIRSWIRTEEGDIARQDNHSPGSNLQSLCCDMINGPLGASESYVRDYLKS